uniref:Ribonuclease H-like domain-containing protein n=1 Tax=Tanacetum cinerariifolium TaxID=118510 RepID=A0A699LAD7_TANCI|nr:ribonuclease H-like domain-containing protein [Tanacetum cinerariifolium]
MTDLGPLNYFLGVFVTRDSSGLFLSLKKYDVELLEKAHMVNCNPSQTPVDIESKLGVDGDSVSDLTFYQSLAGSLQYLTFTRSDISYAVQQVCLHMHDLRKLFFSALKRILRLGWVSHYSEIDFRNMVGFKMDYFKDMRYDDIRPIFEKKFNSNVAFLEKTKEQMEEEDSKALKRASESQAEKAAKKQKLDEKVVELKKHL